MAAVPAASTVASALTPGSGSASRAGPIGISGEAATATPAATMAPMAAAAPISISPAAISWPRVRPSAASAGWFSEPVASRRVAAWPTISSAVTARASANRASATAWGRIARWTAAACVPSTATNTWPPVAGNRRASACARCANASAEAPGRSWTYAPLKSMYRAPSQRNSAGLAMMTGALSSWLTGRTDPRVTTTPTTRSRSSRGRAGPWPAAPAPADGLSRTARMVSTLPTCRPITAAARWSTTISPALPAAGSRPASTLGTSTSRPNRPSTGAKTTGLPCAQVAMAERLQGHACNRRHRSGTRQAGKRVKITAQPRAVGRDEQIRGLRGRQETRVGSSCPPRPRSRRQHRTPRDGHQQHQHRPATPPGTQLVGGEINDCPHPITRRAGTRPRRPPWVQG